MKVKIISTPQAKDGIMLPIGFEGLRVENGDMDMISSKTGKLGGDYHSNGGTQIQYNTIPVEAEKNEPIHIDSRDGSAVISGNMYVPGTNTKFKEAMEKVGKQEKKVDKIKDKATYLAKTKDSQSKYQKMGLNTAKVLQDAVSQKEEAIESTKNYLTDVQNHMLNRADQLGIEPKQLSGLYKKAQYGLKVKNKMSWGEGEGEYNIPMAADGSAIRYSFSPTGESEDDPLDTKLKATYTPSKPVNINPNETSVGNIPDQGYEPWREGLSDSQAQNQLEESILNKKTTTTNNTKKPKGYREKLGVADVLPELSTIFEKPETVPLEQYNPQLLTPYQVSFEDRVQGNQSDFNALQKTYANNPAALGALSAQKYNSDNQTRGEEFRTNQGISNQVTNQNVGIINQAKEMNLKLADEQYVRQAGANANTVDNRYRAMASLATKEGQVRRDNESISRFEALEHYTWDPKSKQYIYTGPPVEMLTPHVGIEDVTHPHTEKVKTYARDAQGHLVKEDDETMFGGGMLAGRNMGAGDTKKHKKSKKVKRQYIH